MKAVGVMAMLEPGTAPWRSSQFAVYPVLALTPSNKSRVGPVAPPVAAVRRNGDGHARASQRFLVLPLPLAAKHLDYATVAGHEARLVGAENEVRHQFSECGADAAAAAAHDRRVESLQLGV